MKQFLLLATVFSFVSCQPQTQTNTATQEGAAENKATTESAFDCNIALKFINDYTAHCNSHVVSAVNYLEVDSSVTENFRKAYRALLDSAFKADPEMGLGSDPVFDAQDYPEKGFELVSCNPTSGFVTVKGKDWPEFILVLKIITQENKWLVDGCGIINIPKAKRAAR